MMLLLIILIATVQGTSSSVSKQRCLTYEPNVVVLHGTIRQHTFAAPPNNESVAKRDEREVVWVLHLSKSTCVAASKDWSKENNVAKIQLVFLEGQKQYDRYRRFLNQRVTVTGTLFQRHTGHHAMRVLITVDKVTKK